MKFTSVKELLDKMKSIGGIWVSADDPINFIRRFVEDHFKYSVEIAASDIKASKDLLTVEDNAMLGTERWPGILSFGGVSPTPEQEYQLSITYMQGICNYMSGYIKDGLSARSLPRIKGKVDILQEGAFPFYEPGKSTVYVDERGEDVVVLIEDATKCCVPLFDIACNPEKVSDTVYAFSSLLNHLPKMVEAFIGAENNLYEQIKRAYGDDNFSLVIPIRTDVTALPCCDYANGRMGVSIFEIIGVVAWRNDK